VPRQDDVEAIYRRAKSVDELPPISRVAERATAKRTPPKIGGAAHRAVAQSVLKTEIDPKSIAASASKLEKSASKFGKIIDESVRNTVKRAEDILKQSAKASETATAKVADVVPPTDTVIDATVKVKKPKDIDVTARIVDVIPPIEMTEIPVTGKIEEVLPPDFITAIPAAAEIVDVPEGVKLGAEITTTAPDFASTKGALDDYLKRVEADSQVDIPAKPVVDPGYADRMQADIEALMSATQSETPPIKIKTQVDRTASIETKEDLDKYLRDIQDTLEDPTISPSIDTQPAKVEPPKKPMLRKRKGKEIVVPEREDLKTPFQAVAAKAVAPVPTEAAGSDIVIADFEKTSDVLDKLRAKFKQPMPKDSFVNVADQVKELQDLILQTGAKNPKLVNQINEIIGTQADINKRKNAINDLNSQIKATEDTLEKMRSAGDVAGVIAKSGEIEQRSAAIESLNDEIFQLQREINAIGSDNAIEKVDEHLQQLMGTASQMGVSTKEMAAGFELAAQKQLKLLKTKAFGTKGDEDLSNYIDDLNTIAEKSDEIVDLKKQAEFLGDKLRKALAEKDIKKVREYGVRLKEVNDKMVKLNGEIKTLKKGEERFAKLKEKAAGLADALGLSTHALVGFGSAAVSIGLLNSALEQSNKYSTYMADRALDLGKNVDWANEKFEKTYNILGKEVNVALGETTRIAGVELPISLKGTIAAFAKTTDEVMRLNREGSKWGLSQEEAMKVGSDLSKKALIPQGEAIESTMHNYMALSKVLRVDVNTAMEQGHMYMRKFGVGAKDSQKIMADTAMSYLESSEAVRKSSIRMDDYRGMMDRVTDSNVHASQNTRIMNQLLVTQLDRLKKLGATDKDAMEGTEALAKAIGDAPEWIKWETGIDLYKDLGNEMNNLSGKRFGELREKYAKHGDLMKGMTEKQQKAFLTLQEKYGDEVSAEQLKTVAKMVTDESRPMQERQKGMETFLGGTAKGMEATGNQIAKLALKGGPLTLMNQGLGLTEKQAYQLHAAFKDVGDKGGDMGKVFSTMMKDFKGETKGAGAEVDSLFAKAVKWGEQAMGPDMQQQLNEIKATAETLINNPLVKAGVGLLSGAVSVASFVSSAVIGVKQLMYLKRIADASGGLGGGGSDGFGGKSKGGLGGATSKGGRFAKGLAASRKITGSPAATAAAAMYAFSTLEKGLELFTKSAEERKADYESFTEKASGGTIDAAIEGVKNPILAVSTLFDSVSDWWDTSSRTKKQEEANRLMEEKLVELKKQKAAQKAGGQTQKQNDAKSIDVGKPESQKVTPAAGAATAVATTVAAQKIQEQTTKPSLTSPVQQQQAVKTATKAAVETAVKTIPSAAAASSGGAAGGRASSAGAAGGGGGLEGNVATILPNGEVQFTVRGFDQIMAQFKQQTVRSTK
jgi:hypothetical protein